MEYTAINVKTSHHGPHSHLSLREKLVEVRRRINPDDILTNRFHSNDFNASRAESISVRIRTLSLIFAILAPLWIPIDYFILDSEAFWQIASLRVVFSISLLTLSLWGAACNQLPMAMLRVFLFMLVPGLFFMASHLLLREAGDHHALMLGYAFLPLLMMALLTLLPLTLLEGLGFVAQVLLLYILTKLLVGNVIILPVLADLWLLLLLGMIAMWVQMSQLHMLMRLYREATRDALTGLVNRRLLSDRLEKELQTDERKLALLLFDLDLFKRINDTYGHHTGDNVLKIFGSILNEHCPRQCLAGRYGGEEFMAILPDYEISEARELAEKIRMACHQHTLSSTESPPRDVRFTTSIGVATRRAGESAHDLLSRVDVGLYQAKSAGRDMVVVAD